MKKPLPIIRWKPKAKDEKPKYRPDIGSGYFPGVSDGSWVLPDWTRNPIEQDTDGVWRPTRRN